MNTQIHSGWLSPKQRSTARIHQPIEPRHCTECDAAFIPVAVNQPTCRRPQCLRSREQKQDRERRRARL